MASDRLPSRPAIKYNLLYNPVLWIEHTQYRQNQQETQSSPSKVQNGHIQTEIWVCKFQHSFKKINIQHQNQGDKMVRKFLERTSVLEVSKTLQYIKNIHLSLTWPQKPQHHLKSRLQGKKGYIITFYQLILGTS